MFVVGRCGFRAADIARDFDNRAVGVQHDVAFRQDGAPETDIRAFIRPLAERRKAECIRCNGAEDAGRCRWTRRCGNGGRSDRWAWRRWRWELPIRSDRQVPEETRRMEYTGRRWNAQEDGEIKRQREEQEEEQKEHEQRQSSFPLLVGQYPCVIGVRCV